MWGMITFSDTLFIGRCTPRRRVRLSPVPESQVEDKGDETSHTVVARKR
jgi:hypothetical protein